MHTHLTQEAKHCPNCGQPLPSRALAGLCPACLLAQGTVTDTHQGGSPHFQPPSLAEIAKLFPQLEILGLLGAGGMGAVYRARQPALDRFVALKILPATNERGVNFAERFNREARALARLNHPNIVAVHEFGQAGSLHYFIMEYVDGANLRQLGRANRLSPREALQVIPQICDALQYAHDEGVVHRDIKPENVLVDRKGRVKIADFGLAKILGYDADAARLTAEGQVMGTPHYMAPEQVERPLAVDHRADIYSLGVVFYELLTGDLPLGKFPPPSRKVQVDVRLDEVVLRALENDPAHRYQRASEVKSQVETIAGTPASAPSAAGAQADPDNALRPGVRILRWAGIPVVVERHGEREVNFQGALAALFVTMLVAAAAHLLVRWLAGTEHSMPQLVWMAGVVTVLWGIRRTLNQPGEDEPQKAKHGTVVLGPQPQLPYWRDALMLAGLFALVIGSHYFKTRVLSRPAGANPPATPDPQTGVVSAQLPGGGTVELLAVSNPNAAPKQWWQPDGTVETNLELALALERHDAIPPGREDAFIRQMILRTFDLPDGADGPYLEAEPQATISSGGNVFWQDKPLANALPAVFSWQTGLRRASVFVGVALQPWRTIEARDPNNHQTSSSAQTGDPSWDFNLLNATDGPQGAQITLVMARETREWKIRIIAVDAQGKEHATRSASATATGSTTGTGPSTVWTYTYPGLALKDVKEFHVQVRPVHWVEFSNIALQPTAALPAPQSGLAFTAPTLRMVDAIVDLDTGHTANFPTDNSGTNPIAAAADNVAWALTQGFDAFAGVGRLELVSVRLVPITAADWEQMTPAEAEVRLRLEGTSPRELRPAPETTPAYAFRTRDNGLGLLRIVEVTDNGQKFIIQLRHAARPSDAPRAPQAKQDSPSPTLHAQLPGRGGLQLLALRSAVNAPWQLHPGERFGDAPNLRLPRAEGAAGGAERSSADPAPGMAGFR